MMRLATVSFVALLSLSPPLQQADEIAALKKQVQELRAQQEQMQRELTAIKNFLQALMGAQKQQAGGPEVPGLVGSAVPTAGEPTLGSPSAKVTLIEVSDYHCPFCKRQTLQMFPQLKSEFIDTGKVQYIFVDYPIAQLHPAAQRSHEAAACAADQGKFWAMHQSLFNSPLAREDSALQAQARSSGLNVSEFTSCLNSGRHVPAIRASVARMEQLGIQGTPMMLLGTTPAPGQPMKVESYVYGARPYGDFKAAIEPLLSK